MFELIACRFAPASTEMATARRKRSSRISTAGRREGFARRWYEGGRLGLVFFWKARRREANSIEDSCGCGAHRGRGPSAQVRAAAGANRNRVQTRELSFVPPSGHWRVRGGRQAQPWREQFGHMLRV